MYTRNNHTVHAFDDITTCSALLAKYRIDMIGSHRKTGPLVCVRNMTTVDAFNFIFYLCLGMFLTLPYFSLLYLAFTGYVWWQKGWHWLIYHSEKFRDYRFDTALVCASCQSWAVQAEVVSLWAFCVVLLVSLLCYSLVRNRIHNCRQLGFTDRYALNLWVYAAILEHVTRAWFRASLFCDSCPFVPIMPEPQTPRTTLANTHLHARHLR